MNIYQDTDGMWKVVDGNGKWVDQAETQDRAMELADLYEAIQVFAAPSICDRLYEISW